MRFSNLSPELQKSKLRAVNFSSGSGCYHYPGLGLYPFWSKRWSTEGHLVQGQGLIFTYG